LQSRFGIRIVAGAKIISRQQPFSVRLASLTGSESMRRSALFGNAIGRLPDRRPAEQRDEFAAF
jgi:hypothetical protein